MKRLIPLLLLLSALVACRGEGIEADGVWGRVSPMAATNGAFYMELTNNGGEDDALVAVRADGCDAVELHESRLDENGVMRMNPVEGGEIPLPAGETVELRPGGLHVMCIGMTNPFTLGQIIPLTLVFATAPEMSVEAEIRAEAP